jgi:hypothetical protein
MIRCSRCPCTSFDVFPTAIDSGKTTCPLEHNPFTERTESTHRLMTTTGTEYTRQVNVLTSTRLDRIPCNCIPANLLSLLHPSSCRRHNKLPFAPRGVATLAKPVCRYIQMPYVHRSSLHTENMWADKRTRIPRRR